MEIIGDSYNTCIDIFKKNYKYFDLFKSKLVKVNVKNIAKNYEKDFYFSESDKKCTFEKVDSITLSYMEN